MRTDRSHAGPGPRRCMRLMHRILAQFTIVALFCGFLVTATPIGVGAATPDPLPTGRTATTAPPVSTPAAPAAAPAVAPKASAAATAAPKPAKSAVGPAAGGNVTVNPNTGPTAGGQTVQITIPSFPGWWAFRATSRHLWWRGCDGMHADHRRALGADIHIHMRHPRATRRCAVDVEVKGSPRCLRLHRHERLHLRRRWPAAVVGAVIVNPNHGPQSGGTSVTITVTGLTPLLTGLSGVLPNVTFGGTAATAARRSPSRLSALGLVQLHDACACGGSRRRRRNGLAHLESTGTNAFTYDPGGGGDHRQRFTVSPNQGPTAGGQTVTITVPSLAGIVGLSLLPVVTFGGNAATGCSLINATVGSAHRFVHLHHARTSLGPGDCGGKGRPGSAF